MIYVPRYGLNTIHHTLFQRGRCKSVKGVGVRYLKTKKKSILIKQRVHYFPVVCVSLSGLCRNRPELSLLSIQSLLPQLQTRRHPRGVGVKQRRRLLHRLGLRSARLLSGCKWLPGAGHGGLWAVLSLASARPSVDERDYRELKHKYAPRKFTKPSSSVCECMWQDVPVCIPCAINKCLHLETGDSKLLCIKRGLWHSAPTLRSCVSSIKQQHEQKIKRNGQRWGGWQATLMALFVCTKYSIFVLL